MQDTGIHDADTFDAFVREYPPAMLFTQFFEEPFDFLLGRIAGHLQDREAGAALEQLTITAPPVPRADGHPDYDERPDGARDSLVEPAELTEPQFVLTRVALYVPFTAQVASPARGGEAVQGALTCVLGNVNQPDNQVVRSWMDVDDYGLNRLLSPNLEQYQERMLEVGRWLPADYPPGSAERQGLLEGAVPEAVGELSYDGV
jgi:hypothetical protein